jgi:hypothetical protein
MFSSTLNKSKKVIADFLKSSLLQDDEKPLQSGTLDNLNKVLGLHSIAEYLPYETYNPDTEIYECKGAKGIVLEANPMVGLQIIMWMLFMLYYNAFCLKALSCIVYFMLLHTWVVLLMLL